MSTSMHCSSFCDDGPRFLIVNVFSAVLNLVLGVFVAFLEVKPWNYWFFMFFVLGGVVNFSTLNYKWRKTRRCGDALGLCACLHLAHFFSAGLLESKSYTGGRYKATPLPTVFFLTCSILLVCIAVWHKKIVCPRDPVDPSHVANQEHPQKFKIFKYSLGPMAAFVYAMAESRFGSGLVPTPHSSEALIGIATSALMFAMYSRRYRTSAWGSLISLIWNIIIVIVFVFACILYGLKPSSKEERLQYGISWLVCLFYAGFFTLAFTFKFCLLREPFHLNFSSPPVTSTVASTLIVGPTNPIDLEAQPYRMTRAEAEATARKLGFGDDTIQRLDTTVTDTSERPMRSPTRSMSQRF